MSWLFASSESLIFTRGYVFIKLTSVLGSKPSSLGNLLRTTSSTTRASSSCLQTLCS